MSEKVFKIFINRLESIENHLKRKRDIDRLSTIERSYFSILIMLFGFAISVIIFSSGKNETIYSISIIVAGAILLIVFYHFYVIITNDLKMRLEAFGETSFYIILIFVLLIISSIETFLKQYIPDIIFGLLIVSLSSVLGYSYGYFNIGNKITKRIYLQCPSLKEEIDVKKGLINKKKGQREVHFGTLSILMLWIGIIIPSGISIYLLIIEIMEGIYFSLISILGFCGLIVTIHMEKSTVKD